MAFLRKDSGIYQESGDCILKQNAGGNWLKRLIIFIFLITV